MPAVRTRLALALAFSLVCQACGPDASAPSVPVTIAVLDAESGVPIPGCKVVAGDPDSTADPNPDSAITDAHGNAVFPPSDNDFQIWSATADGYIPFKANPGEPVSHVFHLYRAPFPQIFIIIPIDYYGPLKLDFRPTSQWIQNKIGQREFTFRPSPTGYVEIPAAPLLLRLSSRKIIMLYDSGLPIPDSAVRFVADSDDHHRSLYLIGDQKDAVALRRRICTGDPPGASFDPTAFNALFDKLPPIQPSLDEPSPQQ